MRRYDLVTGILLILSIIDFALAAPVLVQEKRKAGVDVVHIPKDGITVLGKRVGEELAKVTEELLKNGEKLEVSAGAHASSSSAPPEPEHGSTNVAQAPEPNPAPSTTNSGPLMEPQSSAPESTTSAKHNSDDELSGAVAPEVNPNPKPSTGHYDWNYLYPAAPEKSSQQAGQYPALPGLVNMPSHYPKLTDESGSRYWSSTRLGDLPFKGEPPKEETLNRNLMDESGSKYWSSSTSLGDLLPKVEPPEEVPLSTKLKDEPDAKYWTSTGSGDLLPKLESPKGVGQAHESQHWWQPNAGTGPWDAGPSNAGPSNSPPTTTLDLITGLGVKRPLSPPTDSEPATMGYRRPPPPPGPDLWSSPSLTRTGDERYPGSAASSLSSSSESSWSSLDSWGLPPIPENEVWPPPLYEQPPTSGSSTDSEL